MAEVIECPQCGSANSTKISETEYHCIYCKSNFKIELSPEELKSEMYKYHLKNFNEAKENLSNMAKKTIEITPEIKKNIRTGCFTGTAIVVGIIFTVISLIVFFVYKQLHKSKGLFDIVNIAIENSTIKKFNVYGGTKNPVIWILQEQQVSMGDSTHFILSIIDPQSKKHLKDIDYIPAMSRKDAFNSNKLIGEFYQFGDTCWNVSDQFGLTARDIYSGKIIIDGAKLSKIYPELEKGITKAEWNSSYNYFSISTNDGFEYIFLPEQNKIFNNKDYNIYKNKIEKENEKDGQKLATRNFFMLTPTKRPELYMTTEKTSSTTSSVNPHQLSMINSDPKNKHYISRKITSITHILPDLIFYNGYMEYSDNEKTLIAYQNSAAKNSAMHISCIDSNGKMLWNISGKEIKTIEDAFIEYNRAFQYGGSKNIAALYNENGNHDAIGIDWKSGKILWTFSTKKEDK